MAFPWCDSMAAGEVNVCFNINAKQEDNIPSYRKIHFSSVNCFRAEPGVSPLPIHEWITD